MTEDTELDTQEVPIDEAVVEQVAERASVDGRSIANALLELYPDLLGRHAQFERNDDHVTVDGTRAYRIAEGEWESILAEYAFDDDLATAVRAAHTEQARLLFASAVGSSDTFDADEAGVVIGIDTAEQF